MKKSILVMKSLVLAGALFFVSCNDDDITCPEPVTGELNATETEFSGSWVLSAITSEVEVDLTDDGEVNPSKDIFGQYAPCNRDLMYDFLEDRNFAFKQGSIANDCSNKMSSVGTWGLSADKALTLVASCQVQTVKIETNELENEFSYTVTSEVRDVTGNIKLTKITYVFTKQAEEVTPQ